MRNSNFIKGNSRLLLFLTLALLASCNQKEIDQLKGNLTVEQTKVSLLQNSNDGILISKIDTLSNVIVIHYENGDSTKIQKSYFSKIESTPLKWTTKFSFSDGTLLSTF